MRILALTFPRLGVQLLREASPEFTGRPIALIAGDGDSALVSTVSCEATKDGVEPGMTVDQARQRCPGIAFERDNARECLERLESMGSILKTRATTSVAIVSRNAIALSLDGFAKRFADESAAAQAVLGIARNWSGLDVRGAVGSNLEDALAASRTARRFPVVLAETETTDVRLPRFEPVGAAHRFHAAAAAKDVSGRLGRMAASLEALLAANPASYRRVTLEIERGAYRTAFVCRPTQPIHRASEALEFLRGRVATADLEGATAVHLRLDAPGPAVVAEPWRAAAATVHQLAPAVPVQRRLRLAS